MMFSQNAHLQLQANVESGEDAEDDGQSYWKEVHTAQWFDHWVVQGTKVVTGGRDEAKKSKDACKSKVPSEDGDETGARRNDANGTCNQHSWLCHVRLLLSVRLVRKKNDFLMEISGKATFHPSTLESSG